MIQDTITRSIPTVREIVELIHALRLPLSDEKSYQEGLAAALTRAGIVFEREVRLAPGDIVDFLLEGGLAIEVKLRGQARSIYAQCERYCGSDRVTSLLLATNRAMGLPPEIKGKPVYYASLGRGWL